MLSVGGQQGWEQRFAGRAFAVIDELRVEVRTSADAAFATELKARLRDPSRIRHVPANLYTKELGLACADAFADVWAEHRTRED